MFELNVQPINTSLERRFIEKICDSVGERLEARLTLHKAFEDGFLRALNAKLDVVPEFERFMQGHHILWDALMLKYLEENFDRSVIVITDDMILSGREPVYGRTHYTSSGSLWNSTQRSHAFVSTLLPKYYGENIGYVLKRVMIHEIGHVLGIEYHCENHVDGTYCVMAPGELMKKYTGIEDPEPDGLDFCPRCSKVIDAYKDDC
jgi:predicted Zn-dependent protease